MAITLTLQTKAYMGSGQVQVIYGFTAAGSGDTLSFSVSGPQPYEVEFCDANSNQIVSSPPSFGAWTTTGGVSTATLTANSGGVVTNGRMVLLTSGA